ncbi:hypothetical protein AB0N81_29100 [Streptomyces sp. NPDC093510]|uniref:hypothetical protein n=1 Tax=Streptomyces sp. NPDC093510 TaxID=3155199 RepID=UPI00344AE159
MKSAVSRVVAAVSVVAALGASAACSSSGDDDAGKPSKPRARVGSAALEKAALTAGDIKGYKVETPKASEGSKGPGPGKASPTECGPLAAMLASASASAAGAGAGAGVGVGTGGSAKAHVDRVLTPTDDKDFTTTGVGLSAYAEADAKQTMKDLRTASTSKKCAAFRVGEQRYLGVKSMSAPEGEGDEAVSYKIAHRNGEFVVRESVTVVRSGSTLAVFDASNLYDPEGVQSDKEAERNGMDGIGAPTADEDPKVAPEIVDAQLGKL